MRPSLLPEKEKNGDLLAAENDDIPVAWDLPAGRADQAVGTCDPAADAHLSYGDTLNEQYLVQAGGDILVHAWDLAVSIGMPFSFDPLVAADIWDKVKDYDMADTGLFKAARPAAENATDQEKILAHFGRDIHWKSGD